MKQGGGVRASEWEEILRNDTFDKGLVPKISKEPVLLNIKETTEIGTFE